MNTPSTISVEQPKRFSLKRLGFTALTLALLVTAVSAFADSNGDRGGALGALDAVAEQTGLAGGTAEASGSGCTSASRGPICIWIDGNSTTVRKITVGRYASGSICQNSFWIYAVYPNGSVSGLHWRLQSNCSYRSAWASKTYSNYRYGGQYFPNGTRICVEYKESGNKVGGDPCLTIRS
jgi:hypothetical protein